MDIFRKNNNYYFIYLILLFVFIPINFLTQSMDGISIKYLFEIKSIETLNYWYAIAGRYFHLIFIHFVTLII